MTDLDPESQAWAKKVGDQLRDAESATPDEVSERLRFARQEAVTAADESRTQSRRKWLAPATGLGAAAATVLLVSVLFTTPVQKLPVASELELAAAQEAELLEELEFVAWMVAMDESDEPATQG